MEELTLSQLKASKDDLSDEDLVALLSDEREGARDFAEATLAERRQVIAESMASPEVDPRSDPGPKRREDDPEVFPFVDTPTDAEEVDLETQRKDETSVLATDRFDLEGNRVEFNK